MRAHHAALVSVAVFITAAGTAGAQADHRAELLDTPSTTSLAGPGPISASPLRSVQSGAAASTGAPKRTTGVVAQVFGNGTGLDYSQGGANALGNTGGLTTGAYGSAGLVSGGGGVHSGQRVIAPAPINGAMQSDDARERARSERQDAPPELAQPGSTR